MAKPGTPANRSWFEQVILRGAEVLSSLDPANPTALFDGWAAEPFWRSTPPCHADWTMFDEPDSEQRLAHAWFHNSADQKRALFVRYANAGEMQRLHQNQIDLLARMEQQLRDLDGGDFMADIVRLEKTLCTVRHPTQRSPLFDHIKDHPEKFGGSNVFGFIRDVANEIVAIAVENESVLSKSDLAVFVQRHMLDKYGLDYMPGKIVPLMSWHLAPDDQAKIGDLLQQRRERERPKVRAIPIDPDRIITTMADAREDFQESTRRPVRNRPGDTGGRARTPAKPDLWKPNEPK